MSKSGVWTKLKPNSNNKKKIICWYFSPKIKFKPSKAMNYFDKLINYLYYKNWQMSNCQKKNFVLYFPDNFKTDKIASSRMF